MGLIKARNAPVSLQPFSMQDIEQQARALLLRAKQQADQLLAAAQSEAQNLRAQEKALGYAEGKDQGLRSGLDEGYSTGMQQALEEHRTSFTQLITALNTATLQVEQSRRQLEEQGTTEVLKLAIAIAERVTKRHGLLDPNVLTENAIAAMKLVVHSTDLRIALHPTQKQTLADLLPKLALNWPNFNHVELVEDETLSPGGCRIFTRQGLIDADLGEQLDRIAADLLPSAESAASPPPSFPSPGASPGEGGGEGPQSA